MTELAQHRDDHFPALFLFGERFPASVRRTADCIVEVDEGCLEIAHADWRLRKMRITVHSAVHSVAPRLNIAITSAGKPNPCSNHGISSFVSQLFVPQVQTRVTRQEKESCWRQTRVTSREKRVAGSRRASRPGKRELRAADARHVPGKESWRQQTRVTSREKRVGGSRRASRQGKREMAAGDARRVDGKERWRQETRGAWTE